MVTLNKGLVAEECGGGAVASRDEVVLKERRIDAIEPFAFREFTELRLLDLGANAISLVDVTSFFYLRSLRELYLNSNRIEFVKSDAFRDLVALEIVDLSCNLISELNARVFRSNSRLRIVNLGANRIKALDFSQVFRENGQLAELYLNQNELVSLDSLESAELGRLKHLNLGLNRIRRIDKGTFARLESLEVLDLNGNQIEEIESLSLKNLANLKKLWLASNRLEVINPATFQGATSLEILDLSLNRIRKIHPTSFSGFFHLKHLWLGTNSLSEIEPETFVNLRSLQELDLNFNQLEKLDQDLLCSLRSLESLWVFSNRIPRFPLTSAINQYLAQLKEIYYSNLSVNEIYKLRPMTISPSCSFDFARNFVDHSEKKLLYTTVRHLGCGTFGSVYLVTDTSMETDNQKAVKIIYDKNLTAKETEIMAQCHQLKKLDFPYLMVYYDCFAKNKLLCMVNEYFEGGSLKELIKFNKKFHTKFSESLVFKWTLQLMSALNYLHSLKIIHRNVKPSNIFMNNNSIKLGEVTLQSIVDDKQDLKNYPDVYHYTGPEIISDGGSFSSSSDVWSAGCVLYELLTLKRPFGKTSYHQTLNSLDHLFSVQFSILFTPFLKKMIKLDPRERSSSRDLFSKLKQVENFLEHDQPLL